MKKILFFLAIAAFATTGCVKQEFLRTAFLDLTATVKPVLPVGGSPATPQDLPAGTILGVFATTVANPTEALLANVPYTVEADGSLTGVELELEMSESYFLYGYAPLKAVGNPHAIEFFHGEDLLWARTELDNISAGHANAHLTFEHKMSQVSFGVDYAPETTPGEKLTHPIEGAIIEVTGFYDNCFLDVFTGEITLGTIGNITVTMKDTPVNIITPAGQNMSLHISIVIPSTDGSPAIEFGGTIAQNFDPNTSYVVRVVNIDKTPVIISAVVVPWVNGGSETVNIE